MPIPRRRPMRAAVATLFVPFVLAAGAWLPAAYAEQAAPAAAAARADKPDAAFATWADRFAADAVRSDPQLATRTQYFSGAEQDALDRQLTPLTPAQRARQSALRRAGLAGLKRWNAAPLDETQRVSAAVMQWALENEVANEPFEEYHFVFNQMSGTHIALVQFMTQVQPLRRAADVPAYLARLEQVPARIDEALARARAATAKSLIPPRFIVERAQTQVDTFLAPAPGQNALVAALAERSAPLGDLTPQARAEAIAAATRIVAERIRPAYARVQAFLAELHPRTGDAAGIARLPGGTAAYARALASSTGTTLSPEQIHAIGLREVARIEAEMDRHLRTLGFTEGSIEARMVKLDATLQPAAGADPRAQLLERYAAMERDSEQRSVALFNLRPSAPLAVRREPALTEASAAAHYTLPAPDGSRPGIFWVPLRGPQFEMTKMRTLSYHEGVPGHHFQLAIQQEMTGLPKFRSQRIFGGGSAHSEGWALYTEKLAIENGWYEGDVPGLLGALHSQLFRARRLVVDTGLHAKGWTRQQAIDYGIGAQEVERYVVWPGQACSYMIGMLRIVELREHARAALGAKFSLPAFHDVVLKTGSVPLDVLAQVVEQWIAVQAKS
ncbi:MAG: hypothetical protein JWP34_497 [Massilia sp.]|nr:hypothetical protein [Massilia sp.]